MMHIKHILLVLCFSVSLGLFAQHNEEVTVEGSYRPKVNKVDKIQLKPETPEQVFTIPESKVQVLDIEHQFQLNLNEINPMNYQMGKGSGSGAATKNFLMAGFGSRISPVFLFRHNSNLAKNLSLGVGIEHYSSWLDIKDYQPSGFMDNAVEIGLTSGKSGHLQLGGSVYYKNDVNHYYGIKTASWTGDALSLTHASPQQIYNTVGTRFAMASTSTRNGEFVHDLGFDYHFLFGKLGEGMEHFAGLGYDLGYVDSWWGKKTHPQKVGVALGVQYDNCGFMGQAGDNRLIFKVNPYFEMKDEFYRLHLGVRMDGATKFVATNQLLTVHPDVKGSLFVLDKTLEFYAGLDGGRKMKTYSDLIEENPFVATRLNMEVTTVKLGFEGGVRTNIMNTMDVHVGVRYRHTDNDVFFRQHITPAYDGMATDRPYNSFDVVYDETKLVSVLGNIRWLALDKLTVDAGFAYHKCDPSNEEHAWYRPTIEGDLKLVYQITDALAANTSFIYQGGRWGQQSSTDGKTFTAVKLPDAIDLGLGVDYRVKDQFTVFLKADNLLNRKYQLFMDYPVAGIEAFAGLKLAF